MLLPVELANQTLYEQDYYLWLRTTINQLRAGQFSSVDLENLIEELETMGRSQKRTIKSLLIKLLVHLLRLKYWEQEREQNQGHWKGEIRTLGEKILFSMLPMFKQYVRNYHQN